ncbi:TPA: acyltransferase family protein, partial [Escherichia coli]
MPHFISSRFFRIFPAFIFVLLFATFIVGPLLTTHSMTSYLKDTLTYSYLFKSSYLDMQFFLPGVFEENIYKSSVNGSLWTIPYEVASYVVLLACYMITQSRGRIIPSIICLSIIALPVLGWNKLIFINNDNADVFLMAPCFALGALYAINKDKI